VSIELSSIAKLEKNSTAKCFSLNLSFLVCVFIVSYVFRLESQAIFPPSHQGIAVNVGKQNTFLQINAISLIHRIMFLETATDR